MGRSPCCSKEGVLNRGTWTATEDKILTEYIKSHGAGKWRNIPKFTGLRRCGKSCRLRWMNYLRPDIKRGNLSEDEEDLIMRLHKLLGNRWSLIAGRLPGRTDNEIKNHWNTKLSKKAQSEQSANHSNHDKTSSPLPKRLHDYKESKDPSFGVIGRSKAVYCSPRGMINTGPHLKTENQNADTDHGVQILSECNEEDQLLSFLAKEGNSSMTDYGVGGEHSRSEILDFESSYKILIDRNNNLSLEETDDDQIIISDADLAKVETLNMACCDSDGAYNTDLDFEFPGSFLESAEEWIF